MSIEKIAIELEDLRKLLDDDKAKEKLNYIVIDSLDIPLPCCLGIDISNGKDFSTVVRGCRTEDGSLVIDSVEIL